VQGGKSRRSMRGQYLRSLSDARGHLLHKHSGGKRRGVSREKKGSIDEKGFVPQLRASSTASSNSKRRDGLPTGKKEKDVSLDWGGRQ